MQHCIAALVLISEWLARACSCGAATLLVLVPRLALVMQEWYETFWP